MFSSHISKITFVTLVLAIVLLTASFAASPKLSLPYSDYAQRHRDELSYSRPGDATEYFQRHPELSVQDPAALVASDYFMRHPELSQTRPRSTDLTDYYFRH